MAGVAVHRCLIRMKFLLVLSVAADTPAHIHGYGLIDRIHTSDIAVTGCTGDSRTDVRGMDKMYVARLLINSYPRNRLLVDVILPDTGNLWMGHRDVLVTAPANFHGRVIGVPGIRRRPVTVGAGNVQFIHMDMVIEGDRLSWTRRSDPVGLALMGSLWPEKGHAERRRQYQAGN